MNKFNVKVSILLLVMISSGIVIASGRLTNVGTTAASFLEVGVGSRAIGMGGAFVGIADDVSSLYWNPAGLGIITAREMIFERIDWLTGISFNFFGMAIPLNGYGALGFFINSMTMPKMKVRTIVYPDGTGEDFEVSSIAIGLSYGKNLTDRFSIGFNCKYINESIWHEQAKSIAFDVGTIYRTRIRGLTIGAAITNYGPDMQLDGSDLIIFHDPDPMKLGNNDKIMGKLLTDNWPLPLNMQFGIAYEVINSKALKFITAIDAFHPINNTEGVNLGCELALFKMFFLRSGYKALGQQDSEEGLTFGGGLNYKLFGQSYIKLDYAYTDFGCFKNTNRFSLRLNF